MSDSEEESEDEEEEEEDEEDDDEEEEQEDEDDEDEAEEEEEDENQNGEGEDGGGTKGGEGGWAAKMNSKRDRCLTRCADLFATCLRPKVLPEVDTVGNSDDEADDADDLGHPGEFDLPPPDLRVTLHVVSTEAVKVHDYLAGSNPYLLIKPDGLSGKRLMRRTASEWKTPNAAFDETFEIDLCADELPIRLVVWDHLEEIRDAKTLSQARTEYRNRQLKGDPREGYMQFVEVPDMDVPPQGSSAGVSRAAEGGSVANRKRAMPSFTEIPDALPDNMKQAWFPLRESPLEKLGGNAFGDATSKAAGGGGPLAGGLVLGACCQRLDSATGELLDALGDVFDETELDRRALQRFLKATSDPPKVVWQPLSNWSDPEVSEELERYSGVKCEVRNRVRTHDEKSGELLLPELLPRVVKLDLSNSHVKGSMPVDWFAGKLGPSLAALHTLYLNGNGLEGNEFPNFASLETLRTLDLSGNSFRGDLHALALPPSIEVLNLDYNFFKGPIDPNWFSHLPNVTILRLSGNRLKCELPKKCWHFMPQLTNLSLAKCLLEGPLPASLADAKALEHFTVADNEEVDGEVPLSFLELNWLEDASFAGCSRLGDSKGVVEALREKDVAVQVWGTGIADPD